MDLVKLREAYNSAVERMHTAATAVADAPEDADVDSLDAALTAAEEDVARCQKNIDRYERVERAKATEPLVVERENAATAKGSLRSEPIYRRDTGGFFADLAAAKSGNPEAWERLSANNREVADRAAQIDGFEARAVSTTANAGGQFVAPVWMLDRYVAKRRGGRAYLNALGTEPFLNEYGNSINVPTISTGSLTAFGTAENTAITNQDLVTGSITAATQTVSGQTKASYQLLDLSQAGMEAIIADDISRDLTLQLDSFALNSTTTNAKGIFQVAGTNAVAYTDLTPTVPELFPFLFQAKSAIEKSVFAGVDMFVMHPSTWNWYLSALDSTSRPLALSTNSAQFNTAAGFDANAPQGIAGNLIGLPVIVDPNVPVNTGAGTNQAPVLAVSRLAHTFFEGVPSFRVADQTGISSLQMVFVIYAYAAQMSRYAAGASIVNGTGLIVQAGY